MFCLPSCNKEVATGRSCLGTGHSLYDSINTFPAVIQKSWEGEFPLWASEHIGSLTCQPIQFLTFSGEVSSCQNKRNPPSCNQACKIRSIKPWNPSITWGSDTPVSKEQTGTNSETRDVSQVGHQLFILLWYSYTYQVCCSLCWFHLARPQLAFTGITADVRRKQPAMPQNQIAQREDWLHAYFMTVFQIGDKSSARLVTSYQALIASL